MARWGFWMIELNLETAHRRGKYYGAKDTTIQLPSDPVILESVDWDVHDEIST